ncbi:hypothetical protein LPJ53_004375 [Coemansia erecta]|uniref:Uncharacterized protein n=1 Tax=Coemansia erecta TaxID=147472 RepID=A0A9W8CP86_9FUNG|nr:hypothetical protein LPJ53_004375 [Coemansia erecta]
MLLKSLLFFKASPSKRKKPAEGSDKPAALSIEHAIAQQRLPYRAYTPAAAAAAAPAPAPAPAESRRISRATWSDGSAASNSTLISPLTEHPAPPMLPLPLPSPPPPLSAHVTRPWMLDVESTDDLSAMRPPSALLAADARHDDNDEDEDEDAADAGNALDDEMPPLSPFFSRVPAADILSARDTVRRASISRRNTLGAQPHAARPPVALALASAAAAARTPQRETWCVPPEPLLARTPGRAPAREDPLSLAALASALDEVEWLVNQAPPLSPIFDGYEFSPPQQQQPPPPPPPPKPVWPTGLRRPSRPLGRRKYAAPQPAPGATRRPDRPARAADVAAMAAAHLPRVHALLALAAIDPAAAAHALFGGVPQDAAPPADAIGLAPPVADPAPLAAAATLPAPRLARRSDLGALRPLATGRPLRATASAIGLRANSSLAQPLARRRSELPPARPAHTQLRRRSALDALTPPQQHQNQQPRPPPPRLRPPGSPLDSLSALSRSSRSSLSSMGSMASLGSLGSASGLARPATLGERRRVTPPAWNATPTPVRRLPPVRLHLPPAVAEYAAGPMSAPARALPPEPSPLAARHPAFGRSRPDVRDLFRTPAGSAAAK